MGGIKNKLNKLSNKLIKGSLSLKGEKCPAAFRVGTPLAGQRRDDTDARRATEGSSNKANPLGSRLPSFSQPSEMLTRNTPNTRTSNWWSLYASKTIGSLRLATLTKYLSIACLSLAILSTLILNIVSSYSSSKIESNAIDSNSEVSTLANDSSICDPTNTNAAACISLSITPLTTPTSSPCDTSNSNICMKIPDEGGIATGGHTVEVSSNNVAGYYVMLTGNAGSPAMTPSATTSQAFIQSTTGTLANPTYLDEGQWGSWGIALPNSSLYTGFNTNEMDYSSTDQDVLHKTTWAAVPGKESDDNDKTIIKTTASSKKTDSYPVYYGVRVDSPVSVPADTYAAQVVYTATTNEVPMPTITSTSSNTYELGSGADSTVTITGTNLASTYKVYIESNADSNKQYDITNTITNLTDTGLVVTIPTDQTNPDLEAGDYTIHVVTQGGEGSVGFAYADIRRPTFGYITTMQEMTPEICANAAENETARLIDERDGKLYWVAKLADGNCWMTQNLDLDLQSGTALTPDTSDVSSNWNPGRTTFTSASRRVSTSNQYEYIVQSWDLGNAVMKNPLDAGQNSGSCSTRTNLYDSACSSYWANVSGPEWTAMDTVDTDSNPIDETNHTYDAHYLAGNYYSWQAATAGTGSNTADGNAATSSICPRGWKLPQLNDLTGTSFNNVDGSFNKLLTSYGLTVLPWEPWGNDPVETAYFVAPLYLVRAGYLYWDGSTLDTAGRYGSYSTATADVSIRGLFSLMVLRNDMISSTLAGNSLIGRSVRCVATAS